MYEFINIHKNTYLMESPAKTGLYISEGKYAYVIDTGIDKDAAKKIERFIKEKEAELKVIINTHSHADHCGGNSYLQEKTGCLIYSSDLEASIIRNPVLEPALLYGGSPYKEIMNKFLMAKPSKAKDISEAKLPEGFEYMGLPGHYFAQIGVRTPDDVWFIADSLMGKRVTEKYSFSFMYDVKAQLETLEKLENLKGEWFVPSHAEATKDIGDLIIFNRENLLKDIELVFSLLKEEKSIEDLVKEVFDMADSKINHTQYVLTTTTIKSFLTYLLQEERIAATFKGNRLLFISK